MSLGGGANEPTEVPEMNAAWLIVNAVLLVLTGGGLLVGLAVGARRLLGLQLGVVRTVLAGLAGGTAARRRTRRRARHGLRRA